MNQSDPRRPMTDAEATLIEAALTYWRARQHKATASSVRNTIILRAATEVIRERMIARGVVDR